MATLPFCQMIRASGAAEPWVHSHEESKFDQFGWRCTNKESGYGNQTLVGNFNEEIFDVHERIKAKPLPSQTLTLKLTEKEVTRACHRFHSTISEMSSRSCSSSQTRNRGAHCESAMISFNPNSSHPYEENRNPIPNLSDQRQGDKWMSRPYNHYFETTYSTDFNKGQPKLPDDAKNLKRRHPHSFPGHQPEFDTNEAKEVYNDFRTTSMAAYKPFGAKSLQPLNQPDTYSSQPQYCVQMETTPITHLGARAGPSATGNHVIAPPHAGPGTGSGAEQKSHRTYVGE